MNQSISRVLTPAHERWDEFTERLEGPEGCNFRKEGQDEFNIHWDCDHTHDKARRILAAMGFNVEGSIDFYRKHGGHCDCEILFNVEDSYKRSV